MPKSNGIYVCCRSRFAGPAYSVEGLLPGSEQSQLMETSGLRAFAGHGSGIGGRGPGFDRETDGKAPGLFCYLMPDPLSPIPNRADSDPASDSLEWRAERRGPATSGHFSAAEWEPPTVSGAGPVAPIHIEGSTC